MADETGKLDWYLPDIRTIIPLNNYNVPRSLRNYLKTEPFEYRYDHNYFSVIQNCAAREQTWISPKLIEAYKGLYQIGHLHSVEAYQDNELVGGLYGISYRGAFFGESMFSKKPQASKACLVRLIEHLNKKQFVLLDVQYKTEHLEMFGAVEISFEEFQVLLKQAHTINCEF